MSGGRPPATIYQPCGLVKRRPLLLAPGEFNFLQGPSFRFWHNEQDEHEGQETDATINPECQYRPNRFAVMEHGESLSNHVAGTPNDKGGDGHGPTPHF